MIIEKKEESQIHRVNQKSANVRLLGRRAVKGKQNAMVSNRIAVNEERNDRTVAERYTNDDENKKTMTGHRRRRRHRFDVRPACREFQQWIHSFHQ